MNDTFGGLKKGQVDFECGRNVNCDSDYLW